ncbi:MAG: GAF domain-containing protein, partial [Chloroflexota bacterium]
TKEVAAQATLKASEERFKRIFHSTPISTCVVKVEDGSFIDANQVFQNLVGLPLEALIGHTSVELGFWQSNQNRDEFITRLKEHDNLQGVEFRYTNVPNGPRDTLGFYETIELDGKASLLAMFYDVTEQNKTQKALQTERDFALQVLNNMGQGLTVINRNSQLEYVNPAFANMIGHAIDDLLGRQPADFTPASDQAILEEERGKRQQGLASTYETKILHNDGHEVPVIVTSVPRQKSGELDGAIAVITDLTVQKQTEQALESQIKELTTLHAVATAAAESLSEDEIIGKITLAVSQIYSEVCGILLLDITGTLLTPHPSYVGANISNWQNGYPITEGISGRSVTIGKIIRTGNITKEPGYIEIAAGVMSELCVPIRVHERIIGVINVESKSADAFTSHDEDFLITIANGMGTALERLRLFDEEQRRAREFAVLYTTSSKLIAKWDLQSLLETVLSQATELLNSSGGGIYLYDPSQNNLIVMASQGLIMQPNLRLQLGEGMAGRVAKTRLPLIVDDYQTWEQRSDKYEGIQIRAVIEVPMQYGGELIGVLVVLETGESIRKFTEADVRLLSLFAAQAASAIENVRLFEAEKKRRQEAESLRQAATIISSTLDPDTVAQEILTALKQIIPYDSGSVFIQEGDKLRIAMTQGYPHSEQLKQLIFPADDVLFQLIQSTGQPLIIRDVQNDPRFKQWGETYDIYEWMIMPLVSRGRVIGAITLDSKQTGTFDDNTGNIVMAFAHQAAAAIDNARLYDETQRRLRDLEIINRFSASLRLAQSADDIPAILLDEALQLVDFSHGSIWLYESGSNLIVQRIAKGTQTKLSFTKLRPMEGIVGHVFSSGEKYITPDLKNDMLLFAGNKESIAPGLSGICLPIKSTVSTLGVLILALEAGHQITSEINLLTILAEIAGNALHRTELFDQSQEQIHRLTTLRDIDSAITSSTDLRVTLNILMDHTLKHLKTDAVDIMLYHPELQSLTYLCSAGFNNPSPSRPLIRLGEGLAGQVVMKGGIEQVADLRITNEVKRDPMLVREGFVTYVGIPLIVKGQIKGVFEIFHRSSLTPTAEWMQFLQTLAGQAAIAIDNSQLFEHLQKSNQEVTQAYDTTLEGWARALELRDRETEGHTRRVTELTMQLARFMEIADDDLVNIYRGVLLHDIGKMGVPDQILRKTGPLTETEWDEMRKHPEYAFNLLAPIPYLRPALDIPYCHHEHWDGSGYPRGLKGEQIPLAARVFSIVDIWDALLSDRPYRKAWPREKVLQHLRDISGSLLDPRVVIEFLRMINTDK